MTTSITGFEEHPMPAEPPFGDLAEYEIAGGSGTPEILGTPKPDSQQARGSKRYADIAALLKGGLPDPPQPVLLTRNDGRCIFYGGQVNLLFGDAEGGKTFIALATAAETLKFGQRVVFIDIDHNGVESIAARLLAMGVPPELLSDPAFFRYVEPEDKADLLDITAFLCKTWKPNLVIIDSVGELLPLMGFGSNSPDDFTTAHALVVKGYAVVGACVILIDHVAKNVDSRAAGPTGTNAKRRAIGGVSIRVSVKDQFVPGHGGSAYLTINKDRHGGLRQHCPRGEKEPSAGLFVITSTGDRIVWDLKAPTSMDALEMTGVSQVDVATLGQLEPPPKSVRDVTSRLPWGTSRATAALREWRSRNVPEEQGTPELSSVPVPQPPVSGTRNTDSDGHECPVRGCSNLTRTNGPCVSCSIDGAA